MFIHFLASPIRRFINWLNGPARDYEAEIAVLMAERDIKKRQKKKHSHYDERISAIRSEQLADELERKLAVTDFARL